MTTLTTERTDDQYTATDIQVLEGMEAVRRRPGMYIGSTDQRGLDICNSRKRPEDGA